MNVALVIARLKDQVAALKLVGGAAEIGAAAEALAASPAAFVIEERDVASPMDVANEVHQRVDVSLSVFLAVRNAKDSRGQSGADDLETLRLAVRTALLGWSPESGVAPLLYVGGELFRFEPGLIWWREGWRTDHYIRSA